MKFKIGDIVILTISDTGGVESQELIVVEILGGWIKTCTGNYFCGTTGHGLDTTRKISSVDK